MQLDLWIRHVAAEERDLAVLGLAEVQRLRTCQHQRKLGEVGTRAGTQRRLGEGRHRRLVDVEKGLCIQLDASRGRVESVGDAVGADRRVLPMLRLQSQPDPGRVVAQLLECDSTRLQLVRPGGVEVAVEEVLSESEPSRKIEDDLDVRACLTWRADQWTSQLHERVGVLGDLESDLERLGLEGS